MPRKCRQKNGAEGYAYDPKGKIHEAFGISDHACRPWGGNLTQHLVEHIVDLHGPRPYCGNCGVFPHEADFRVFPSIEGELRRNSGLAHAPQHERHLRDASRQYCPTHQMYAPIKAKLRMETYPNEDAYPEHI